jgi:hypothetical protein
MRSMVEQTSQDTAHIMADIAIITNDLRGIVSRSSGEVDAGLASVKGTLASAQEALDRINYSLENVQRVTERLEKADGSHLDAVIAKAEDMGRQLAAKREHLKELQRAGRRPGVTRVREQDVVVALGNLRELLEGNVGVAAQVLKALVGYVVIEARPVEGRRSPEMVATFTIDGLRAFAALDRGKGVRADDPTVGLWEFLHGDRWIMRGKAPRGRREITVSLAYDRRAAAKRLRGQGHDPA